jgi:hypothetical protein
MARPLRNSIHPEYGLQSTRFAAFHHLTSEL